MAATPNRRKTAAVAARREAVEQKAEAAATSAAADPEKKEDSEWMATVSSPKLKQRRLCFPQVGHALALHGTLTPTHALQHAFYHVS